MWKNVNTNANTYYEFKLTITHGKNREALQYKKTQGDTRHIIREL